ncbi:MAG: NlpC/P60 family protein [Ruminococcaceae bacterium]|nr:NlpC/P60 family protein [Oscillospiraceae bacterium]
MISLKRIVRSVAIAGAAIAMFTALAFATELKTGVGTVYDASGGLRLREKASTSSGILSTASNGDTVVIIRKSGDWYLVDYNLKIGYMHADFLEFDSVKSVDLGTGKINCAVVNVRTAPSTDGDLMDQLAEGYEVKIIGINNCWYKVTYGDKTGYIRSDLLELTSSPAGNAGEVVKKTSTSSSASALGTQISDYAQKFLGVPYVWGGTTAKGFDCSGFTQYVYKQFGYSLYRVAASQLANGTSVKYANLQPGDLVFFANTYASNEAATHVGIYIGDGEFVHAASGGVKITDLSDSYYASRYVGARRII